MSSNLKQYRQCMLMRKDLDSFYGRNEYDVKWLPYKEAILDGVYCGWTIIKIFRTESLALVLQKYGKEEILECQTM